MKFIFKYNDLIQRNRTELLSETGDLCFWGIYDFAFKYRTRIFDKEDVEIACVEKDVTASKDTVRFYDAAGKHLHTFSTNSVGEILNATGDTFTSRNGSWIYTWSKDGKKISTRSAR